jgi:uncharacterized SAM-binding protein YcdF (DUF218 family)
VRPAIRHLSQALGLLLLAAAIGYTVALVMVLVVSQHDERRPVVAIIVLGAAQYNGRPSAIYRARLEHAVDLWNAKAAPLIVFTGGNEPGDRYTEGASGARWAVDHGVPASATLVEQASRTTYGNLAGAKQALDRHGSAPRHRLRVIVVSDPFHMFRAVKQARDLGLQAYPSPTRSSPLSASKLKLTESVLREDLAIGSYVIGGRG